MAAILVATSGAGAQPRAEPVRTMVLELGAGDTLSKALGDAGVSPRDAYGASKALAVLYDPRDLRVGQELKLTVRDEAAAGVSRLTLERLDLIPERDRLLRIERRETRGYAAREIAVPHSRRLRLARGTIGSSLYEAARDSAVPARALLTAGRKLAARVDFARDLRAGDSFALGFEVFDDGPRGGPHPGQLVYASLRLSGQRLAIYRYTTADGYSGFFDEKGNSVETSLVDAPVADGRISSLFGKRRHPVLGYSRAHEGVDFAAARGTPVLAAGDGVVVRRARYGSFGKYVRIRHDSTYATAYAHLARYAKGLAPGDRVRQGEVIGYVGATGLVSGPNLHYEVLRDGRPVDPLALELPPRRRLDGAELDRFRQAAARLRAALEKGSAGDDALAGTAFRARDQIADKGR